MAKTPANSSVRTISPDHLAHNVNLAMKAIVGVACYGRLIGDEVYIEKARGMAERLLKKIGECGNTPLTLDGQGWSMKYNLLWDKVLHLSLISEAFYASETKSYLARMNTYGLPLDSRADYTKSDWLCWSPRWRRTWMCAVRSLPRLRACCAKRRPACLFPTGMTPKPADSSPLSAEACKADCLPRC